MADLNKIIDDLSSLTVVEAAELSKQLEEKWGVTAVAAAPAATAASGIHTPSAASQESVSVAARRATELHEKVQFGGSNFPHFATKFTNLHSLYNPLFYDRLTLPQTIKHNRVMYT